MPVGKNQDKPLRGLNWTSRGLEKNQNKPWSDFSKPEEMFGGKNQDKLLRDLNWTSRGLEENQNKSWSDLSELENVSTSKESG